MERLTRTRASQLDHDQARDIIYNRVYAAAIFLETLADVGRIAGEGNEMAERIAQVAVEEFEKAWIPVPSPSAQPPETSPENTHED